MSSLRTDESFEIQVFITMRWNCGLGLAARGEDMFGSKRTRHGTERAHRHGGVLNRKSVIVKIKCESNLGQEIATKDKVAATFSLDDATRKRFVSDSGVKLG